MQQCPFIPWNLMHLARMTKDAGGFSGHGNQLKAWDTGTHCDSQNLMTVICFEICFEAFALVVLVRAHKQLARREVTWSAPVRRPS